MFDMYNVNLSSRANNDYFEYYTIKKGDNLYQIAKKNNVNPSLLALLNGLNTNDYIYPDQVIMIPKDGYAYYITKEGDTLNLVANTFNTNVSNLLKYNKTIYLQEGQLIVNKIN
jgi:LysM repeat protein